MVKYKALYKAMYDDLKDSEMMICYADEIRENKEDAALADVIAKYAQYRLNHFMEFHKLFENESSKEPQVNAESVAYCMWDTIYEMMMEWYGSIKQKIEKF